MIPGRVNLDPGVKSERADQEGCRAWVIIYRVIKGVNIFWPRK